MKNLKLAVLLLITISLPFTGAVGQDGKYKVKVITDKDGKKEVYEKTYTSKEEMASDPNLGAVNIIELDSIEGFTFKSDTSGVIHIRVAKDGEAGTTSDHRVMVFSSDQSQTLELHGEEGDSLHSNVFVLRKGDKTIDLDNDFEFKSKDGNVIILKGEKDKDNVFFWNEQGDGDIEIQEDKKVIVKTMGGNTRMFTTGKRVELGDPTTSEVRAANYTEEKKLVLKSVEYQVNATEGTVGLKFQAKSSPVSIEIRDSSGSQVYEEALDPFNGSYSGKIDLSGQKSGTYILEIRQGQKSVYKKLTVR